MSERLEPGVRLQTVNGMSIVVDGFLGAGGQGDVYRVKTPEGDKALKYYFDETSSVTQRNNLSTLVSMGFEDEHFLWPLDLVDGPHGRRFGYVMDIRPPGWATIPELLSRNVEGATIRSLYRLGINLAVAFRSLHSRGLAYRDISWGNVFFMPISGQILVCDNDNAVFSNMDAEVAGTMKFMAPEVVRREAKPSAATDLHSLAVLLFMVLVNGHPLEGALEAAETCLDEEVERRLYGERPIFLFDPTDTSNRPIHGIHDTVLTLWPTLPRELKNLFTSSFTTGLLEPNARTTEGEWVKTLTKMHDRLFACGSCGRTNVFDKLKHETTGMAGNCWKCSRPLLKPPLLLFAGSELALEPSAVVLARHVGAGGNGEEAVAELIGVPNSPGNFGLRNCSASTWSKHNPDGSVTGVPPGKAVLINAALDVEIEGVRFTLG